jgi:hypothetical protein
MPPVLLDVSGIGHRAKSIPEGEDWAASQSSRNQDGGALCGRMKDLVGDGNVEVRVPAGALSGRVVHIPPELLLHGNRAELTLKGPWLADTVTGTVVGKYVSGPETLTLFPNSVILVTDLARLLRRFHPSPCEPPRPRRAIFSVLDHMRLSYLVLQYHSPVVPCFPHEPSPSRSPCPSTYRSSS